MTIQSDENIANSYKTVQKRTVSRTEYQRNTTKQIELCELQFLEKPEYKTGLYIDVCKEYIKDLNKEITNVRKNMPEKLKIQ